MKDNSVIFGISTDHGSNAPVVMLGVCKKAWDYMKNGNTHTFNLTKVGLNLKIVMYGAETQQEALKLIQSVIKQDGNTPIDMTDGDFSI